MRLEEFNVGDNFTGFFILKNVFLKVTNSGKPYLSCSLADASMMVEAKAWDYAGPIGPADEGKVAKVQCVMQEFKGAPQIKIERIRIASEQDDYDLSDLVPVAPINRDAALSRLETLVDSFEDEDYNDELEDYEDDEEINEDDELDDDSFDDIDIEEGDEE